MKNFETTNNERRYVAYVGTLGTTQVHQRHPLVIAWWSAAFPGFGHLLLSKYLRGYTLFIWEVLINTQAKINLAMLYSFIGDIDKAKDILEPRWVLLYIPTYLFGIWDSYRTAVDLNKISTLARNENAKFCSFNINTVEINYLDKRNPVMAIFWSLAMPGMGQLYIHRIIASFFALGWLIVMVYLSHFLEAVHILFIGNISHATKTLDMNWFLYMPSLYGFAMYDAYVNSVENNKLFEQEQRKFLIETYQKHTFMIPKV